MTITMELQFFDFNRDIEPIVAPLSPTAAPVSMSSLAILENSAEAMKGLASFRVRSDSRWWTDFFEITVGQNVQFQAPYSQRQQVELYMNNLRGDVTPLNFEYIKIDDKYFEKEPLGEWVTTEEYEGYDVTDDWLKKEGDLNWPIDSEVILDTLNGNPVYRIIWGHPEMSDSPNYQDILELIRVSGEIDDETEIRRFIMEYWIDPESYLLRNSFFEAEISGTDSLFESIPFESDFVSISGQSWYFGFNEPMSEILAPVVTLTLTPTPQASIGIEIPDANLAAKVREASSE